MTVHPCSEFCRTFCSLFQAKGSEINALLLTLPPILDLLNDENRRTVDEKVTNRSPISFQSSFDQSIINIPGTYSASN